MTQITIHSLFVLPYSALNRDDSGSPKHYFQGGVMRAQLSSQSLKRSIRLDFEGKMIDQERRSIRSSEIPDYLMTRINAIAPEVYPTGEDDVCHLRGLLDGLVGSLTRGDAGKPKATQKVINPVVPIVKDKPTPAKMEQAVSYFLSLEELETLAVRVVNVLRLHANATEKLTDADRTVDAADMFTGNATGSLSIAAFGRMFAAAPQFNTEAAIAVSDASCVHESLIEVDYFTTASDPFPGSKPTKGASFLAEQAYTSGVFYGSKTIDIEQLKKSYTGMNSEHAPAMLADLVRSTITALPRGKKNSTAPYTPPLVVLTEVQSRRQNYHFETPVTPDTIGGYSANAVSALAKQAKQLREFDPSLVSKTLVAGTADNIGEVPGDRVNLDDMVAQIVELILQ